MLHRLRANLRFTAASGMAAWAQAQMAVRYAQAVHIREGEVNEELKRNEIIDEGAVQVFVCDLPLLDQAHAADAYNTLTNASVLTWLASGEPGSSWVEHHTCRHDETPPSACSVVSRWESE